MPWPGCPRDGLWDADLHCSVARSCDLTEASGAVGSMGWHTVDQARDAASARLGDVAKGIDPREARLAVRANAEAARAESKLTLATLVDDWATLHLAARRPSYRTEAVRAIRHAFADYLKRPAVRLSRADVIAVHDRLVAGGKP